MRSVVTFGLSGWRWYAMSRTERPRLSRTVTVGVLLKNDVLLGFSCCDYICTDILYSIQEYYARTSIFNKK